MGYREPLQVEILHHHIQGDEDELLMLKMVAVEVSAGAMKTPAGAVMALFRVASFLTAVLDGPVRGIHVACKLEQLRKKLESFIWFKARTGVQYDPCINRVTVLPDYFARYELRHDEPVDFVHFRLNGMLNYRLLHRIFTDGGVGKLDMQWVISRLNGGDPNWSPKPVSYWWWDPYSG